MVVKVLSPQNMSSTSVEQRHRYAIAGELVRGKVVLEIGLGDGRGSSLVVQAARQIVRMEHNDRTRVSVEDCCGKRQDSF